MCRIRVEPQGFHPDKFFDIFFCERWLFKVKIERGRTYRFIVDIMKRRQIGMAEGLINCKKFKAVKNVMKCEIMHFIIYIDTYIPVILLEGSNTSIFSSKSIAPEDMFGNFAFKFCFGYCGSCLTYLRALLLRRNPRLLSSGDPINYQAKNECYIYIDRSIG